MSQRISLPAPSDGTAQAGPDWAWWPAAWTAPVLGPAGPGRVALVRLLCILPGALVIAALIGTAAILGMSPMGPTLIVMAYGFGGQALFYVALRAGWSRRCRDPGLVLFQLCFNISAVVLVYAQIELARSLVVQWICLMILFDMRRLTGRQVRLAASLAYGLLMLTMAWLQHTEADRFDMAGEVVNLAMAGVTLICLLAVTRVARRLHEQRKAQRAALAETVAKLDELAMRDGLTGAYNRRHLQGMLEAELRRQARGGRSFCVAMLDIDHFKQVNDRFGHAVGDTVLREVARLLDGALAQPHALGRWGGEEFLLLMPDCPPQDALAALQAAAKQVSQHHWGRHALGLTVSFSGGISVCQPAAPGSAPVWVLSEAQLAARFSALIEAADQALYSAKAAGRNRIHLA